MSEMIKFDRDFIIRTKEILDKYYDNEKNEVTFLLNCLLALVCFPIEQKKDNFDEKTEIFREKCIKKLEYLKNPKPYINNDASHFFENIRNSIAHLNIKFMKDENPIKNITLFDIDDKGKTNFKINISITKLKEFAEYVANEYLETYF